MTAAYPHIITLSLSCVTNFVLHGGSAIKNASSQPDVFVELLGNALRERTNSLHSL